MTQEGVELSDRWFVLAVIALALLAVWIF